MTELVSPDGSPFVVSAGSDWRGFPGSAWLEAGAHGIGSRFLVAYLKSTSAAAGGQVYGAICTITDDDPWTYTVGAPFLIESVTDKLRFCDAVSVIDDTAYVSACEYVTATGINHLVHLLRCDDPASSMTSGSSWSRVEVPLGIHTQNVVSGRVHKLQNGKWLQGYYTYAGSSPTAGVAIVDDPTDWSSPTFVTVGAGFTEINVEELGDGTLVAHLRDNSSAYHYGAVSTDHGLTWTAPTQRFAATAFPMFRELASGILFTAYRHAPSGPGAWRWAPDLSDSGWTTETTFATDPGRDSAYATALQLDDLHFLVIYALQTGGASATDADVYSEVFTDLTIGPTGAVGWDAYAAADPNGAIVETIQSDAGPIEGATGRAVRIALNEPGSGLFKINRQLSPVATAAALARDNIIKCRFPWRDDYDFAFILEKGDFTLAAAEEKAGEEITWGGRGILAYLTRGVMDAVAYTTGLDINDTWTEIWNRAFTNPTGCAVDPADPTYAWVIRGDTRRIYKVRQSDRVVVATSPVLFPGWAGGLCVDPSDATIFWAIETPWITGSASHTRIHKVRRSDYALLATFDLGSAIKLTDIQADATHLWTTRDDGTVSLYKRSKADGSVVTGYTITYGGVPQTGATGSGVNGTQIAIYYYGKKRALIASIAALPTISSVITTTGINSFGGPWTTEAGQDYFYLVSYVLDQVHKYQVTAATPHDPVDGIWRLDEGTAGAILWRIITEAQAAGRPQQPFPDLTIDFDDATDSNGNAWATHDGTLEFDAKITDEILETALRLIPYGLVERMRPNLLLEAFNRSTYGVDRTGAFGAGVVRFEKGVNILPELGRQSRPRELHSHMLATGKDSLYARATLADLGFVREGGIQTDLEDATALEGTAEAVLDDERVKQERIRFKVRIGDDEAAGEYLPFTHYNEGDLVTLHTGDGEHDFNEETFVLYAFTLAEGENGKWETADVELGSATIVDAAPTAGGGSGGSSGTGSIGGPPTTQTSITVEGIDDTGATLTSASGRKIRIPGAAVYQEAAGVIRLILSAISSLLGLSDVDADDIVEGQTLVRSAEDTFVPGYIEDLATEELDTGKRLAPDGIGGVEFADDGGGILVGTVTPDGSPVTVLSSGSGDRFPGAVQLDSTRIFVVFQRDAADVYGLILTTSDDWASFASGAPFLIRADSNVADAVSIVDGQVVIASGDFDGLLNTNPVLLICDDAPADLTSASTWSEISIPLAVYSGDNLVVDRVTKLANGTYLVPYYGSNTGSNFTGGVLISSSLTDWSGLTRVVITPVDANNYTEIDVEEMPDGELVAHIRTEVPKNVYLSTSSNHGLTWSGLSVAYSGFGLPMFRRLASSIFLTVYRHSASDEHTYWRQSLDGGTTWSAETLLDGTLIGGHASVSAYATLVQIDDGRILCIYSISDDRFGAHPANLYSQMFVDSTIFATDGTLRVSEADTTPGFLEDKLTAGIGVTITKLGTGGDESLELSVVPAPSALDDLSDVDAAAPADQDVLTWDDASGTWIAQAVSAGAGALDDLTDVTIASVLAGHLLRYSGSAWVNTLLAVADYPYHDEVLCDSAGPILQSNGDVITVTGVPN